MGRYTRNTASLSLAICLAVGLALWAEGIPESKLLWAGRIGLPVAGGLLLCFIVWASSLRKDRVPDYLRQQFGRPFEQDGFCFGIGCVSHDHGVSLEIYFQSRYSGRSRARVAIRQSRTRVFGRPVLPGLFVDIDCPGAAFGVTRVPWAVPQEFQGKRQSFDVAAGVYYPEGCGRLLRFRQGLPVGEAAMDDWSTALSVATALTGNVILYQPAKIEISIPKDVREHHDDEVAITTTILWKPGDPEPRPCRTE